MWWRNHLLMLYCCLGVVLPFAPPVGAQNVPDLQVDNIEVTQGIQTPNNTIGLVAERETAVRVRVNISGVAGPVFGVDAILQVLRDGVEISGSPFRSLNGPITAPLAPDRANENHTSNFEFLGPLASANVTIIAEVNPDRRVAESDFTNNTTRLENLNFQAIPTFRFFFTPLAYAPASAAAPNITGPIRPGTGDAFMRAIVPVDVNSNYRLGLWPQVSVDFDDDGNSLISPGGEVTQLLAFIDECRQIIIANPIANNTPANRVFLYSWLADGTIQNFAGWGRVGGRVGFGQVGSLGTHAHETVHNFGLKHNEDVGRTDPRPIDEVGWDVGNRLQLGRVKPAATHWDIMNGMRRDPRWIHTATYNDLLTAIARLGQSSAVASLSGGEAVVADEDESDRVENIWVRVRIAPDGSAELLPVKQLPWDSIVDPESSEGRYILTVETEPLIEIESESGGGVDDTIIYQTHFDGFVVGSLTGEGVEPETPAYFSVIAPSAMPDGRPWSRISILDTETNQERDARVVSGAPPVLTIISPADGATLSDITTVRWIASDPDGDPLRFTSAFSADGGQSFVPAAIDIPETFYELDTKEVAGTTQGVIVVIATDGVHTTTAQVSGLVVPLSKPPLVFITQPQDGAEFLAGANIVLLAQAEDREDGPLAGVSLSWESDRDGALGTGRQLQVSNLSLGTHIIRVTATDSDGMTTSAEVSIIVQNREDPRVPKDDGS